MNKSYPAVAALAVAAAGAAHGAGPLASFDPPLDPGFAALLRKADVPAGEAYFERKCSQCHDAAKAGDNGKGPHLWNVLGRMPATRPGFHYSPAMAALKRPWSYSRLDYYLRDTAAAVPGRAMDFGGIADAATRANLIGYLRTLHDQPPELP